MRALHGTVLLTAVLAAAAVAAHVEAPPRRPHPRLFHQATATVRIVAGARVTPDKIPDDALVTKTEIRDARGTPKVVKLIEFP